MPCLDETLQGRHHLRPGAGRAGISGCLSTEAVIDEAIPNPGGCSRDVDVVGQFKCIFGHWTIPHERVGLDLNLHQPRARLSPTHPAPRRRTSTPENTIGAAKRNRWAIT